MRFIVFEGIDGCGKSTQIRLLKEYLERKGYKIWTTGEPTDSKIGKLIKELLKEKHVLNFEWGRTMSLLFAADRYYHQLELKDKIEKGYIILGSRYYYSSFAYQLNYPGVDENWLKFINSNLLKPDIVFIIDVDPEIAVQRLMERGDERHVYEKLEFLKKVRENYLKLKDILPNENIVYINGNLYIDEVFEQIRKIIDNYL